MVISGKGSISTGAVEILAQNGVDVAQVIHNLAVENTDAGIYGMVDTVIILKNGEVVPVDVKYTDSEIVRINWKKQLTAYALLLEARFGTVVKRGFIYFPAKRRLMQIDISEEAKTVPDRIL